MDTKRSMKDDLYHRTALVTGASRGLGFAISKKLWNAGASLVLVARSESTLQEMSADFKRRQIHPDQSIHLIPSDLSDTEALKRLIEKIISFKIDILINNAAIQGPIGPVWENDWEEWQRTLQVNLLAPIALCRALVPQMISQRFGKIINLSGGGAASPRMNFSAYTVSKAGLVRFSETLAEEIKLTGICVNCIAPGMMNTELHTTVLLAGAKKAGQHEYNKVIESKTIADNTIMDRAAELCTLLTSERGNGITGKLISAVWDPWQTLNQVKEELMNSDIYTLRRIVPKDRGQNWDELT